MDRGYFTMILIGKSQRNGNDNIYIDGRGKSDMNKSKKDKER